MYGSIYHPDNQEWEIKSNKVLKQLYEKKVYFNLEKMDDWSGQVTSGEPTTE